MPMFAFFAGLPVFAFLLTPKNLRSGRKEKVGIVFGLLMIAALLGMLAACGSGGGSSGGGGGETGQTYTITVWAISGDLNGTTGLLIQKSTVTMTVN